MNLFCFCQFIFKGLDLARESGVGIAQGGGGVLLVLGERKGVCASCAPWMGKEAQEA